MIRINGGYTQYSKIDKLYINTEETRILHISNIYYIEYKNKIFPKFMLPHHFIVLTQLQDQKFQNGTVF